MDILDSFTIGGVGFGQNINYSPQVSKWVKLSGLKFLLVHSQISILHSATTI
jgi:hypothetical protein